MNYEIIHLPKEKWKGTVLPMDYTTNEYYDVRVIKHNRGFSVEIERTSSEKSITHNQEE